MRSTVRISVISGILVAQLVMLAVLFVVSSRITASAEHAHTDALLETAAVESSERVRAHLEPVEAAVAITAASSAGEPVGSERLRATLLASLEQSPQLAGVFVASVDGDFFDVRRVDEGYRVKTIEVDGNLSEATVGLLADPNDELATDVVEDEYDPTVRPWFAEAVTDEGELVWTEPYRFFSSGQLGITAAQAIVVDGETVGVIGADIELGSLSSFLSTLVVGDPGGIVIFDDDGNVIATSDDMASAGDENGLTSIDDLLDPLTNAAVAAAAETTDEAGAIDLADFDARVAQRAASAGPGTWHVTVFAGDDSLAPILGRARGQEKWLLIAVGALTTLLVAAVALPATRSILDLEARASTDALTGLANRATTLAEIERLAASASGFSVAMIDLDHFKVVNDTYGHPVGDVVLTTVASRIEAAVRSEEALVGRIGGEEFLVLFENSSEAHAKAACERIAERLRSEPISAGGVSVDLTTSIGLATFEDQANRREILRVADKALFDAKKQGRDQVVVYVPGTDDREEDRSSDPEQDLTTSGSPT